MTPAKRKIRIKRRTKFALQNHVIKRNTCNQGHVKFMSQGTVKKHVTKHDT